MAKLIKFPKEHKIPTNWKWVKLGNYIKTKTGYPFDSKRFSKKSEGLNGLIRIRDIVRGYTETFTNEECTEDYIIHKGDMLIGMDGDFNIAKWNSSDAFLNQRVCLIKSNSKNLLNDFLFYYLPYPLESINETTPSMTVKHLSTKTLEQIPFPLPPLAEQERIVNKLDNYISKLDEAKEKLEKVVDTYNYRKNLILHRAFTGQLTKNWRKENNISFDNWKEFLFKDVLLPMTSKKPTGEYFRYIDIDSIDNEFQEVKEPKYIQTEKASSRANRELKTGDVIFSLVRPYLRNIAFIDETLSDCIASTGFYVCRANKKIIPEYLYKFLCFDKTIGYLNKFMRGFNSPSIRNNDLLNMPIPLPPLEEQKEIVKILDSILSKEKQVKEIAEKEIERLEDLKKNLLTRAFGGVLGTNDPNEENSI